MMCAKKIFFYLLLKKSTHTVPAYSIKYIEKYVVLYIDIQKKRKRIKRKPIVLLGIVLYIERYRLKN